jgi:hypothetical protein
MIQNTQLTKTAPVGDGISGYSDEVTGKETKRTGLFRGTRLKFGKTAEWEIKDDGEVIAPETRFVLTDIARLVTRWGLDKKPAETVVLEPGEKWPDLEAWNDQIPRTEWLQGMKGPQGPWQSQSVVYFVDPKTMSQYHWPDGSVGGSIAIREVVDSIRAMRRFRPGAAPVVELSSKHMKTKFGGRERPHFVIVNWVTMPGEEPQPAALPAPAPTAATMIEAKPVEDKAKPSMITTLDLAAPLEAVEPPTIAEEMNDEIGF